MNFTGIRRIVLYYNPLSSTILNQPFYLWKTCCRQYADLISKNYDLEFLRNLDKEKLAYRVIRLQRLVSYYENICSPQRICGRDKIRISHPDPDEIIQKHTSLRKIALKFLYLGWDYVAYAWEDRSWGQNNFQGNTNVVERVLLEALLRQQLIPSISSINAMSMTRCGRTDQGVSSTSQVLTMRVRSNLDKGYGVWSSNKNDPSIYDDNSDIHQTQSSVSYYEEGFRNDDTSLDKGEIPYVKLLNQALPTDIRVLAWAPVSRSFDARRDCRSRTYRYVFPRGRLNIPLMKDTAQKFTGTHDFRNFCKRSEENVFKHFVREITSFEIKPLKVNSREDTDMCCAIVCGKGFLHNQIRKMMGLLIWVGQKKIEPSAIDRMLDVENCPRTPSYDVAVAQNLTLIDCHYDTSDICWRWDDAALAESAKHLGNMYSGAASRTEVLRHMYESVVSKIGGRDHVKIAAEGLVDSMLPSTVGHLGFDGLSKTVEEKQNTIKKRRVRSLINKGAYRRAVELRDEQFNDDVSDEDIVKS